MFIIQEGFREVSWARDDRMTARTSRPTADVKRVEYGPIPPVERAYLRGLGAFNSRNWANVLDPMQEVTTSSRSAFFRIDAHLKRAQALQRLRRFDDALVDAQAVISRYAEWVQVVDAMALVGEIHLAAGNQAEATNAFRALRQAASRFGGRHGAIAVARGALGEAQILGQAGKHAEVVPLLRNALAQVPVASAADYHGRIAGQLGDALLATGAKDEARTLFEGLRFAPISAEHRGKAFLELGKMHLEAGDRIAAVDSLLVAAVLRGGSDEVRSEARRRVRPLLTALGSDESLDPETQREYRSYGSRLQ
ncbi:MAG: hypothetical protein EA402_12715 [Planctomycetota bacterium]|nr:MAG: hypothetical protein EA402_12715 [Planctomycetota bacterium]